MIPTPFPRRIEDLPCPRGLPLPGRELALAERRTVAVLLAHHVDLEVVAGPAPVSERCSFTRVPQHLRVRLHRRRRSPRNDLIA